MNITQAKNVLHVDHLWDMSTFDASTAQTVKSITTAMSLLQIIWQTSSRSTSRGRSVQITSIRLPRTAPFLGRRGNQAQARAPPRPATQAAVQLGSKVVSRGLQTPHRQSLKSPSSPWSRPSWPRRPRRPNRRLVFSGVRPHPLVQVRDAVVAWLVLRWRKYGVKFNHHFFFYVPSFIQHSSSQFKHFDTSLAYSWWTTFWFLRGSHRIATPNIWRISPRRIFRR